MRACNACEDFHADNESCPKARKNVVEYQAGLRFGKMSLGRLMTEEAKAEEAYNKSITKEKQCYDKYLTAMSERAVKMEHWLNAQRELELQKRKMGIQSE